MAQIAKLVAEVHARYEYRQNLAKAQDASKAKQQEQKHAAEQRAKRLETEKARRKSQQVSEAAERAGLHHVEGAGESFLLDPRFHCVVIVANEEELWPVSNMRALMTACKLFQ